MLLSFSILIIHSTPLALLMDRAPLSLERGWGEAGVGGEAFHSSFVLLLPSSFGEGLGMRPLFFTKSFHEEYFFSD